MRWRQFMRTLLLFGRRPSDEGSADAVRAAEESHARAVADRIDAARTRAVAERFEAQVRLHNSANRYDDFLRRVMGGEA